jgi:DNA polymerase delta subunit 3
MCVLSMLYDFHRRQNGRKPGSVHATYLVTGEQAVPVADAQNGQVDAEEDMPVQSSPYMSSSMPMQDEDPEAPMMKVITLVREEHLESS